MESIYSILTNTDSISVPRQLRNCANVLEGGVFQKCIWMEGTARRIMWAT